MESNPVWKPKSSVKSSSAINQVILNYNNKNDDGDNSDNNNFT